MVGKGFRTGDIRGAFGPAQLSFAIDSGLTTRSPAHLRSGPGRPAYPILVRDARLPDHRLTQVRKQALYGHYGTN
jgi:hypothetical protein